LPSAECSKGDTGLYPHVAKGSEDAVPLSSPYVLEERLEPKD